MRVTTVVLFTLLSSLSCPARADVASCIQRHVSGQRATKAGHLRLASKLFASCGSSEACPDAIRTECVELYGQVQKSIPTVIFTAADEQGNDLTNVRVYSSDQLLTESLDGRAIELDPGKHHFRFVLPGEVRLRSEVLVCEGEKNRVVSVRAEKSTQLGSRPAPTLAAAPASGAAASAPSPGVPAVNQGSFPAIFWASAALGTAALASWGGFALLGREQQSKLAQCSPNCPASLHDNFDAMRRDYLLADISLGVAVASAGIAAWMLLVNRHWPSSVEERRATSRVSGVSVLPMASALSGGLVVNLYAP